MAKLLHVAGDINRTVVLESVLLLGVFQKLQEQRVVDVDDRDYETLLLFPLAHHNRQASFRNRLGKGYKEKMVREKGQGSEAEMARLKRVREESVRDFGTLLMIYLSCSFSVIAYREGIVKGRRYWNCEMGCSVEDERVY
nr:uncharacterized protein LOC114761440 [Ipomoea batatas]